MKNDTKKELNKINLIIVEQICNLFDVPPKSILTVNEVRNWDSINHINLMIMIEDSFSINLDYQKFKNCDSNIKISELVMESIND
tara:strand:+ start:7518 stop:7772 length:255 start_codon:yes stop_codon:yes gene_type:complete